MNLGKSARGLLGLQHIALKVHDIEAGIDFYVNTLGFTISEIHPPGSVGDFPFGLCFMRCTALHHDLNPIFWPKGWSGRRRGNPSTWRNAASTTSPFRVASRKDLEAWDEYLKGEGIEIFYGPVVQSPIHPDGDGLWGENRAFYFSDPSGNCIEINCDMAPMDPGANRVDEAWFRDRLERDGHPRETADPPSAWAPDLSFIPR